MSELAGTLLSGRSWDELCQALREAGLTVLASESAGDDLDRAEALRLVTRLLRGGLENFVEHNDPTTPRLVSTCHETIKIVAENPDNNYLSSAVSAAHDYRVWGKRGTAAWLSFNTHAGGFGSGGKGTAAVMNGRDLETGGDGSFELFLSRDERHGNWLRLDEDSTHFIVRETVADPASEEQAELFIERTDGAAAPPPTEPEELGRQMASVGQYLGLVSGMADAWARANAARPFEFVDVGPGAALAYADPEIIFHQAYWELADDEALLTEVRPPDCEYWGFCLYNRWLESLDYRYHPISLNNQSARLATDGSLGIVVAARDPGLSDHPNWLDTTGHRRGTIGVRWVGKGVTDVIPQCRVIKV